MKKRFTLQHRRDRWSLDLYIEEGLPSDPQAMEMIERSMALFGSFLANASTLDDPKLREAYITNVLEALTGTGKALLLALEHYRGGETLSDQEVVERLIREVNLPEE